MKNIFYILLLVILFSSCNKDEVKTSSRIAIKTVSFTIKPRIEVPKLESSDVLIDWMEYYQSFDPTISLDSFSLEGMRYGNFIQGNVFGKFDERYDDIYDNLIIYSPNGKKYIDFDSYQWSIDENQNLIGSIDQEVNLVDIDNQTVTRIHFSGPTEWVENAYWKNDSIVVLLENSFENILRISEVNILSEEVYVFRNYISVFIESEYSRIRLKKKGLKFNEL